MSTHKIQSNIYIQFTHDSSYIQYYKTQRYEAIYIIKWMQDMLYCCKIKSCFIVPAHQSTMPQINMVPSRPSLSLIWWTLTRETTGVILSVFDRIGLGIEPLSFGTYWKWELLCYKQSILYEKLLLMEKTIRQFYLKT